MSPWRTYSQSQTSKDGLVIRELTANLMAVSSPWGHNKGHLELLQDPAIYLARNGW